MSGPKAGINGDRRGEEYRIYNREYLRFAHNYFTTPFTKLPAFPDSAPSQRRYFYLDVSPPAPLQTRATLLLLHGFPDSSYGWRKCIVPLTTAGYRVIVPDLLGYGRSSKPKRLEEYGAHTIADDLSALMTNVLKSPTAKFIVVGHDWGSWLAWKLARWIPERLLGVHGICVAYVPPTERYVPMDKFIERYPQFGYQAFFEDPRSTKIIEDNLDNFLKYVLVSPSEAQSSASDGLKIFGGSAKDTQDALQSTKSSASSSNNDASLLSPEESLVSNFLFNPKFGGSMEGPLTWYRTRKVTYNEERPLASNKNLTAMPYKMLCPRLDPVGQASLAEGARRFMPPGATYRIEEIEACGHWAMLEKPEAVVQSITQWIEEDVLPSSNSFLHRFKL